MAGLSGELTANFPPDAAGGPVGRYVFPDVSPRPGDQCPKGQVPSQSQSVARYVAKYVVSPPIAGRRIDRYDGARVTYQHRPHRTDRVEHETVAETFIGRMVQHTVPKGFKRIRYYGMQVTKTFAKVKLVI